MRVLIALFLLQVAHEAIAHVILKPSENVTKPSGSNATLGRARNGTTLAMVVVFAPKNTTTRSESNFTVTPDAKMVKTKQESKFCQSTLTTAINDFSFELMKRIKKEGNLLISPLGVSEALTMVYHGAGGNTAKQLREMLFYQEHNLNDSNVTQGHQGILESNQADKHDNYTLLVANGLFLQEKYALESKYEKEMESIFKARVEDLDFAEDGKSAISEINSWVASATNSKIQKMLDAPLDSHTSMALMNAAYFKGLWRQQFPANEIKEETFHKLDNTTKKVSMMTLRGKKMRFNDCNDTQHKFLEIPYKGNNVAMLVALPYATTSPPDFEMTSEKLCSICNNMKLTEINEVSIPKFKLEQKLELKDQVKSLGAADLFGSAANLTGISKAAGLHMDSFLHKAVVEVGEEGNKPSDFTQDAMQALGAMVAALTNPEPISFVVNHPFSFHIVDKKNGLLLFSGRVTDPSS